MKNKKAFTVVELVIVIAIIAILAAVLIPTFAAIIKKANVSKDQQLIKNLNTALATDRASNNNQNHMTMTDALKAAEDFGYDVSKINASATDNTILWDQFNDVFCYYDKGKDDVDYIPEVNVAVGNRLHAGDYRLWKIYNAKSEPVPAYGDQTYSIYLGEGAVMFDKESNGQYKFKVGVDVGKNTDVLNILYDFNPGSAAGKHSVIIRTDSMNAELEVIAPYDDVKHFGIADTVTLTSISATSYYEYGHVMVVNIKTGRLIITNYPGAKVEGIFLSATGNIYDNIILAIQEGAKLPTLIRRQDVTNPASEADKILVAKVQKVNADGSVVAGTEEFIYLYGEHTAKEQDKGYVGVSELGTLILEALSGSTEPGVTDAIKVSKTGTLAYVKSAAISNSFETESTNVFLINDKFDLLKLAYMVNNGEDTTGKTYKLTADIDLEGTPWTPIGYLAYADSESNGSGRNGKITSDTLETTNSRPFKGTFDGQGYTIYNLKISHPYTNNELGFGLFGLVVGSAPNSQYHGSAKADTYVYNNGVFNEAIFNDVTNQAVVKNIVIDGVDIEGTESEYFFGSVVGISYNSVIDNCDVQNVSISTSKYTGGVVGTIGSTVVKNCDNKSGSVVGDLHMIGGIVGSIENWFGEAKSHSAVLGCSNYSSVRGLTTIGGIVGHAQSNRSGIIAKCTNYGDVSLVETDSIHHTAGGICGWGTSICLYYHCTNNGAISGYSHTISDGGDQNNGIHVGGITCRQAASRLVNCTNTGELSGYANFMGGIVSYAFDSAVTLENCSSTGTINNSATFENSSGKYCAKSTTTLNVVISGTLPNLDPVQDYVNSLTSSTLDLTALTVVDKTGVLVIPSTCTELHVNGNMCEKVSIGERNAKTKVYAPGVEVVLAGNNNDTRVYEASKVTINLGVTLDLLLIENVNETVNRGNLQIVKIITKGTATNNLFKTYFKNEGTIGSSNTSNIPITFLEDTETPGSKAARYAIINFYNNGSIRTTNDNAIKLQNSSTVEHDVYMNLYLGANTNIQTGKRIAHEKGNIINLKYDSAAAVSPNFAIMDADGTYSHAERKYYGVIDNVVFETNLNSFKTSDYPYAG